MSQEVVLQRASLASRPLPETAAELHYLNERLHKLLSTVIGIEAEARAVKQTVEKIAAEVTARCDQAKKIIQIVNNLANEAGEVIPSALASAKEECQRFAAMPEPAIPEFHAISLIAHPHRRAMMKIEVETYGRDVEDYFPSDTRRKIDTFRDMIADPQPHVVRRFANHSDFWQSIREAIIQLQQDIVAELGRREAKKAAIEIELDAEESDIVRLLQEAGRRLTTQEILAEFSKRDQIKADSTTKLKLSQLVRRKILNNRQDLNPRGYGLPSWQ